jgi:type I restriction-modification system DNA methylase subunit
MITGTIKSQIDQIWNAFWSGGISNPLEVIEQITYLLFLRRLDDLHTLEENKAARLKEPIARRVFPAGRAAVIVPDGVLFGSALGARLNDIHEGGGSILVSSPNRVMT